MRKLAVVIGLFCAVSCLGAEPSLSNFTVRCLNKDGVVTQNGNPGSDIELEMVFVFERETQLRPDDFCMSILDAKQQQPEGVEIFISHYWQHKKFNKGETKKVMSVVSPTAFEGFNSGREYYLVISCLDRTRVVKFKVAPRTPIDPRRRTTPGVPPLRALRCFLSHRRRPTQTPARYARGPTLCA